MRAAPGLVIVLTCALGCVDDPGPLLPGAVTFAGADAEWSAGAAEYPPVYEPAMRITLERRRSPGSSGTQPDSFYTAGHNGSDDLFLFVKRTISDLQPGATYLAQFCAVAVVSGVGQSMIAKAGVVTAEPRREIGTMGGEPYYVMNVDKGTASDGGRDVVVLGRLGDFHTPVSGYITKTLCPAASMSAMADENGVLWLFVGADSDFEILSEVYWVRIDVKLTKQ
jgi:hypothetical protein